LNMELGLLSQLGPFPRASTSVSGACSAVASATDPRKGMVVETFALAEV
jgi:hypothetical protein